MKGLQSFNGNFGRRELLHLLRRSLFAVSADDLAAFDGKSLQAVVDQLVSPIEFDQPLPVNDYDQVGISGVPYGRPWIGAPYQNADDDGQRIGSFRKWSLGVMINQDRSLREKMSLFWHNHFSTQVSIAQSELIWKHFGLLRSSALGNFKKLCRAITIDPHMLRFLNGELNTALAPNENYGRELQELFCIGKGPNGNYKESDVKEAARVLTGWKVDLKTATAVFHPEEHDTSDKKFSSFYNNCIIRGRKGPEGGPQELDDLLDMIFRNNETANFICRKIYRWFVNDLIDDKIEAEVIRPLADLLIKENYEIRPVLRKLLTSEHFFDPEFRGSQFKSPLEFALGIQREFAVTSNLHADHAVQYSMLQMLAETTAEMGQLYGEPPNVAGWPAYYQAPAFYELWINSSTLPKRNEFSSTLVDFGFNREGRTFSIDVIKFARSLRNPEDPGKLISESLERLIALQIPGERLPELKKQILLTGQDQDHYWTDAWKEYLASPNDPGKRNIIETRLKKLYRYILNTPEYQLN